MSLERKGDCDGNGLEGKTKPAEVLRSDSIVQSWVRLDRTVSREIL